MNAKQVDSELLSRTLIEVIAGPAIEDIDDMLGVKIVQIGTFAERGILTSNDGFVLTFADGSEFQITVVRSSPAIQRAVTESGQVILY